MTTMAMVFAIGLTLVAKMPLADEEPITFTKTKLVYQEGDDSKTKKVRFRFETEALVIHDEKKLEKSNVIIRVPWSDFEEITYERSKHPRAKTAIFLSPFALFSKGKKHWLYLTFRGDSKLFQMDKKEYQAILMNLESKTGLDIERVIEE